MNLVGNQKATRPFRGGNRTLCDMVGIDLRLMEDGTWDELEDAAKELAAEYRLGTKCLKFQSAVAREFSLCLFKAAEEISAAPPFDCVLVATGSGSTATGLSLCAQTFEDQSYRSMQ